MNKMMNSATLHTCSHTIWSGKTCYSEKFEAYTIHPAGQSVQSFPRLPSRRQQQTRITLTSNGGFGGQNQGLWDFKFSILCFFGRKSEWLRSKLATGSPTRAFCETPSYFERPADFGGKLAPTAETSFLTGSIGKSYDPVKGKQMVYALPYLSIIESKFHTDKESVLDSRSKPGNYGNNVVS